VPERRSIGADFVGSQRFRGEGQFPEELAYQPGCRAFLAPPLHQHVEDLHPHYRWCATGICAGRRSARPTHRGAIDRSGVGGAGQVSHNDGTKFQDPVPYTFIRDLKSTLRQTILDVAIAQRKAKIQPNRVPDDRGAGSDVGDREDASCSILADKLPTPLLSVTMPSPASPALGHRIGIVVNLIDFCCTTGLGR
jgi:hypothetical protein